MGVEFKNNAESTLAGNINTSVTTFALAAGEGNNFPIVTAGPTDYFYVTVVDVSGNREVMKVTEHQSGDTFQVVERGADDTSGLSFVTDDKVQMRFPKIILEAYRDDIATNAAAIAANALLLLAPAGLKMFFYEDTAPSGWTIDVGPADSLLAVKGGAQDYNVAGQQVVGSWTPTTHTHTGPSHTHTGPSHTHTMGTHTHTMPTHLHSTAAHALTKAQMPAHNHLSGGAQRQYPNNFSYGSGTVATKAEGTASPASISTGPYTSTVGSGSSHTHGNTGSTDPGDTNATDPGDTNSAGTGATGASGTAATGASSAPSTDRPQAAVGLIATKD